MKSPTLTPTQITDLLNFVLGGRIYVFVVKTWTGHQCYQVEQWIDRLLRNENILPPAPKQKHGGRPSGLFMPLVLRGLVGEAKAKGAGSR